MTTMIVNKDYGYGDARPDVAANYGIENDQQPAVEGNLAGGGGNRVSVPIGEDMKNLSISDNGSRRSSEGSSVAAPPGFLNGTAPGSKAPIGPRRASVPVGGDPANPSGLLQPTADGLVYDQGQFGYAPRVAARSYSADGVDLDSAAQYGYETTPPARTSPMTEGFRRATIQFGDHDALYGNPGASRRASWFAGDSNDRFQRPVNAPQPPASSFQSDAPPYRHDPLQMAMRADTHFGSSLQHTLDSSNPMPANLPAYGRSYAHHRRLSNGSTRYQNVGYHPGSELPDVVYQVKFKRFQKSYVLGPRLTGGLGVGTYVKVEADRGEDLGIVVGTTPFDKYRPEKPPRRSTFGFHSSGGVLRKIIRLARQDEVDILATKREEEAELLEICREKAYERGLPMMVVDAEYQFDRHKLTFFFKAEARIDFRHLVRELYTMTGTRIWMEQINGYTGCPTGYQDADTSLEVDNSTPIIAPVSEYSYTP